MTTPEQKARVEIDARLTAAGWHVQSHAVANLSAGRGVALREYPLATGYADYLLFVDGKAIGVVEAKAQGIPLSGAEPQTRNYTQGLPPALLRWHSPLPYLYQSSGVETWFTDSRDPEPRSRALYTFHRPETLAAWAAEPDTLRARVTQLPPLLTADLWAAQIEAITNLERSLAEDRPRALIQMTMGSGKTFTAVNAAYRLIKYAGARRVLFLVDRSNLGRQALAAFKDFKLPDTGARFGDVYDVQLLDTNAIDRSARVVITTIQRLYSILCADSDFDPALDAHSPSSDGPPRTVAYNAALPIEFFDVVIIDECHRSIYNLWRQVVEYFDAWLIGLTATPSALTLAFFNKNLVMEYDRARAVRDGVNVDGQVFRIRTHITAHGSTVQAGLSLVKRDRLTRRQRWQLLDDDFTYTAAQLDLDVVTPDQIRTILTTYRDSLFTELFPGRTEVPKTLVFAKDDAHAEEIVRLTREVFAKGNDFCQKITYRVSGIAPETLINQFRNSYSPRIAVTVDMIATGADIRPLEVLIFLRDVKSGNLYDQMLGRGTRTITPTDLQAVTPDATIKDRFILVDAVGVTEHPFSEPPAVLNRNPTLNLAGALHKIATGLVDEDTLLTLADRLSRLDRKIGDADRAAVQQHAAGRTPGELADAILSALDFDAIYEAATAAAQAAGEPGPEPSRERITAATAHAHQQAAAHFHNPALRTALLEAQQRSEITVDPHSLDTLLSAEFTEDGARNTVESFRTYIEAHRDQIDALQIIFARPYAQRHLTLAAVKELAAVLRQPPTSWTTEQLWRAYTRLEQDKVRGAGAQRTMADIISLVRHAVGLDEELIPFADLVAARYARWLEDQQAAGRTFTPKQRWWLETIARQIGINVQLEAADFDADPFYARGGRFGAHRTLGPEWLTLVTELNTALVPLSDPPADVR